MADFIEVADPVGAKNLAKKLLDPKRDRILVAVSIASDGVAPWIDLNELVRQASEFADIYLINSMSASWEFAENMPEGTQVYGGAGRCYPLSDGFVTNKTVSPVRMAHNQSEGEVATQSLLTDVYKQVYAHGLLTESRKVGALEVSGKVIGFAAGRALVQLENSEYVSIVAELTFPNSKIEELFSVKQRVSGILQSEYRRLDVSHQAQAPDVALADYQIDDIVLGRVQYAGHQIVQLMIYPATSSPAVLVNIPISRITENLSEDLRDMFVVGDVVRARVVSREPVWQLELSDISDEVPFKQAPPIFAGGPAWINLLELEAQPESSNQSELRTSESEVDPDLVKQGRKLTKQLLLDIANRKAQETELIKQIRSLGAHLEHAEGQRDIFRVQFKNEEKRNNQLETELAKLRAQLRRAKLSKGGSFEVPTFANHEDGFRYRVLTRWAIRIPIGEQPAKRLPDYLISDSFLSSVKEVQGISEDKIADVVVEILLGTAQESNSREVHHLREGSGASERQVTRSDGATCWRASLQVGSPSARRIHYWVLPGGLIELSRVALHDDFNP